MNNNDTKAFLNSFSSEHYTLSDNSWSEYFVNEIFLKVTQWDAWENNSNNVRNLNIHNPTIHPSDLSHAHFINLHNLNIDEGSSGIVHSEGTSGVVLLLLHAREYPPFDPILFPYKLGHFQTDNQNANSNTDKSNHGAFDYIKNYTESQFSRLMHTRNILWKATITKIEHEYHTDFTVRTSLAVIDLDASVPYQNNEETLSFCLHDVLVSDSVSPFSTVSEDVFGNNLLVQILINSKAHDDNYENIYDVYIV